MCWLSTIPHFFRCDCIGTLRGFYKDSLTSSSPLKFQPLGECTLPKASVPSRRTNPFALTCCSRPGLRRAGLGLWLSSDCPWEDGDGADKRVHESARRWEKSKGKIHEGALPCYNEATMVQVFVTTELLSNELRAATSDEAAACRDDTRKNLGFGRRAEESANRIANSRQHSALAGCAGWGGSRWN